MKVLFLSLFFFLSLGARDNPFTPLFDNPAQIQNDIPILNVTTNPTFTSVKKIKLIKKVALPTIKIVEKISLPPVPTVKPVPVVSQVSVVEPIMIETQKVVVTKTIKKRKKKTLSYSTIYQNYFLRITTNGKNIKIITKDKLIEKRVYKSPSKVSLDFDKLQYFHTKSITLHNPYAKKLRVGSHHDFYRITLLLKNKKSLKTHQKSYGYLLVLD